MEKVTKNTPKVTMVSGQLAITVDETGRKYVQFLPDNPSGQLLEPFRAIGSAQLLRNASFDFLQKLRERARSETLLKLRHGRLSYTRDKAIQLTLKIFDVTGDDPVSVFDEESREVVEFLKGGKLSV